MKIFIAVILSISLLYVVKYNFQNRPEHLSHSENGYTFEFNTVTKGSEKSLIKIPISITGNLSDSIKPVLRKSKLNQDKNTNIGLYITIPLSAVDTTPSQFYIDLSANVKGELFYYYFEVRDQSGGRRASFTQPDGSPFTFKSVGEIPIFILTGHIVLIIAAVFCITLAMTYSIPLITGSTDTTSAARFFFLGALFTFMGGYPFGMAMSWYASGGIWEGVPFGIDTTDNKTQLLFISLLFIVLSTIASLTGGKKWRDLFSPKALGWFGVGAYVIMLIFLSIPHSIQFPANLIYSVSYSFIGMLVLIFLSRLLPRKKRQPETSGNHK